MSVKVNYCQSVCYTEGKAYSYIYMESFLQLFGSLSLFLAVRALSLSKDLIDGELIHAYSISEV